MQLLEPLNLKYASKINFAGLCSMVYFKIDVIGHQAPVRELWSVRLLPILLHGYCLGSLRFHTELPL